MSLVLTEIDSGTRSATLTLNRPEKRNALSRELVDAINSALTDAERDPNVRTVVLRGAGKAFCAGADLSEIQAMQTATFDQNLNSSNHLKTFFQRLYTFPKPTIAAVHGPALAGGCGLATCCDFVLATGNATFGYPEVKIGFIPALVMVLLTHQIGERSARDLCLSGRAVDATEAQRLGLITRVTDDLDTSVSDLCRKLAKNSPQAMASVKSMLPDVHGAPVVEALDNAARSNATARASDDCKEGIAAFLEKRKPNWI